MITMDDTQTRLLDAAGQVFAEVGFKSATIREICRRAGARNVAAVNYYFRDKEQLYHETLLYAFKCGMEQMPTPQWPMGVPPEHKLRDLIRVIAHHIIDLQGKQQWQMQLLLRELSQPSPAGAALVRDFIRPLYELNWAIVRELLPGVAEDRIHLVAFSIVGQLFYHRVGRAVLSRLVGEEEHATYTAERLAEHVTAFSLAAIAGLKAGGTP
jgi:TetR/AcrR family transcriptional regulator, regulator of cefoperazone and chloramphenicol sensitivity